tara:strand:+ start:12173 stop:12721 length:549 start_codon:yes stop_codon:yes gene_type:complete
MTTKLKTIKIKGRDYVEVNERLMYFRDQYPNYSLTSEVIEKTDNSILILASIMDEQGRVVANGLAEEEKGSTFINKTSYVENCETSAWGRCLANFGIGLKTSIASAEEVQNAISNQGNGSSKSPTGDTPKNLIKLELDSDNWVKALKWISANKEMGLTQIVKTLQRKYSVPNLVKAEIKKNI